MLFSVDFGGSGRLLGQVGCRLDGTREKILAFAYLVDGTDSAELELCTRHSSGTDPDLFRN